MSAARSITSVEKAAVLPGEFAFLSSIVADLNDHNVKLVYADWLEEQGDARTKFVRELTAAAQSLRASPRFPETASYPNAWTNMLGALLLEGIVEYDLIDVADSVLRLARPIVNVMTEPIDESQLEIGASKFGGHPDLPADVP